MNLLTGFVVYFLIWWTILFAVLPWGVSREENPEPGHDPGAPARPMLWKKVGATTVIAGLLWLVAWWLISASWISFRPQG
jgi:predicted secreted protein